MHSKFLEWLQYRSKLIAVHVSHAFKVLRVTTVQVKINSCPCKSCIQSS